MHLPPDGKQLRFHLTPRVGDVLSDGLGADVMRVIAFDPLTLSRVPQEGAHYRHGAVSCIPRKEGCVRSSFPMDPVMIFTEVCPPTACSVLSMKRRLSGTGGCL